jgi:hypothetical protein
VLAKAALVFGLALMPGFWAASCTPSARESPRAEAGLEGQLLSVARAYLEAHHPDWVAETYALPSRITDMGDCWQVTFDLPQDTAGGITAGGTPVIIIEKSTFRVIKAFHEQ